MKFFCKVGQLSGTTIVTGCENNGEVKVTNVASGYATSNYTVRYVGGIAGQTLGTAQLLNSTNNGVVTLDAIYTYGSYAGGITGRLMGTATIQNVTNNGDVIYHAVTNGDVAYVGGIVAAYEGTPTLTGAVNNGNITTTATKRQYTGGIVGSLMTAVGANAITDCLNTGDVTNIGATDVSAAAGIVGRTGSSYTTVDAVVKLKNCVNLGTISANSEYGGGMIGYSAAATPSDVADENDIDGDSDLTETFKFVNPYTVDLENCVGYGAGLDYALIGRVMSDAVFTNCFGNTSDLLAYRNQNGAYYYSDGSKSLVKINGNTVTGNNLPHNPATTATISVETLDKARLRTEPDLQDLWL